MIQFTGMFRGGGRKGWTSKGENAVVNQSQE